MAEPLQIIESAGPREDVRVIKLVGPSTIADSFKLQAVLRTVAPVLLVDLSEVPYMDSAAFGCIIRLHVACESRKSKYAIIGVPERLLMLFKLSHVESILICYPTVEEALAHL